MDEITRRLAAVQARIRAAELQYHRAPGSVTLVAVSKTHPAGALRQMHERGQRHFGESYLDEALDKQRQLADLALTWHFIGPVQSNKTRGIAESFDWVHSVDRLKVARRLSDQRPSHLPPLQVCVQVNISGESTKSGVTPDDAGQLATEVAELPRLRLRGLMGIPAPASGIAAQRRPLRQLRECLEALSALGLELDTLSMGMTADLEAAIAEGATLVRVGTALFGPRGL